MRLARCALNSLTLLLLAAQAIAADAPEIVIETGASEIFVGESVDYVVEIRNVDNPPAPDLSALRQDFDVVANGDESRNQSSTFIINGRVSQQSSFSHVFRFRLTPKRSGHLVIPAPSATIGGKLMSGRAVALDVKAPEEQDLVVPEMKTDRQKVYPTQPFEVTLRVLVHPIPDEPERDPLSPLRRVLPHIDVNWVDLPSGLSGEAACRHHYRRHHDAGRDEGGRGAAGCRLRDHRLPRRRHRRPRDGGDDAPAPDRRA